MQSIEFSITSITRPVTILQVLLQLIARFTLLATCYNKKKQIKNKGKIHFCERTLNDRAVFFCPLGPRWLDKLGLAARLGLDVVMRQVLIGAGSYHLVDNNLDPLPVRLFLLPARTFKHLNLDNYDALCDVTKNTCVYKHFEDPAKLHVWLKTNTVLL